ncbi:MAG: hypothetical protein A2X08_08620 [Bacteroidetes bacterium GWA2_32_17]|nr:MAG: hypothetical protein A2X08_08620 [Bacteroidetes bacterium GWA2_32_17]
MNRILHLFLILTIVLPFITSCTIEKRLYLPGYNFASEKQSINNENKLQNINAFVVENRKNSLFVKKTKVIEVEQNYTASIDNSSSLKGINNFQRTLTSNKKQQSSNVNNVFSIKDSCDNIILKNGKEIWAKEIEIGVNEISYKKCDNINGPALTIKTSDVLVIKYANGSIDVLSSDTQPSNDFIKEENKNENNKKQVSGLAVLSFIFGIVGFIILGIPLGITAIVFGLTGENKINKNREKYMGKGFALAGIILGFIDIIGVLIILSML